MMTGRNPRLPSRKATAACTLSAALAALAIAGCGGSQIEASTECREFLQAPLDEQNAAIARIADEVGARNALTPLGRPNINYLCSRNQDMTVGEAIEATG